MFGTELQRGKSVPVSGQKLAVSQKGQEARAMRVGSSCAAFGVPGKVFPGTLLVRRGATGTATPTLRYRVAYQHLRSLHLRYFKYCCAGGCRSSRGRVAR